MTINQLKISETQMTDTPDSTIIQKQGKQTFVMQLFFNHNATETFEDKFLRVILAEERKSQLQNEGV